MYRVRVSFTGMQGSPWISTFYFNEAGGSAAQAVAAVGAFWSAVDALMDNECNWTTLSDVETVDEVSGDVTAVTSVTPITGSGGLAGEAIPIASQGLVRWRTGSYVGGREIRGRTFIPALTETANDNGILGASATATIQAAADALRTDVNSVHVIWSRQHQQDATVTSASVWANFAVLRSRRD